MTQVIIIYTPFLISIFKQYYCFFKKYKISCCLITPYEYTMGQFKNAVLFSTYYVLNSIYQQLRHEYILLQVEQYVRHFTPDYLQCCHKACLTVEYSSHNSHLYMSRNHIIYSPLVYYDFLKISTTNTYSKKYDIGFYGSKSERRQNILNKLSEHFTILIMDYFHIMDNTTVEQLSQCRLAMNIHYESHPAILETARLNELIITKIPIISENSRGIDLLNNNYDSFITYIDIIEDDLSNIQPVISQITSALTNLSEYNPNYEQLETHSDQAFKLILAKMRQVNIINI
jgi:hypothetical protein